MKINIEFLLFTHKPTKVEPSVLDDISPGSENVPAGGYIIFFLLVLHINNILVLHINNTTTAIIVIPMWCENGTNGIIVILVKYLSQTLGCGVDIETNLETVPG